MQSFQVIVIGAGPAGVTAALRARELRASVALVEGKWMGGTCTNDGCVPTRVLAKTARLLRETDHFGTYGLVGERPVLDFPGAIEYARRIVEEVLRKKGIEGRLADAGVKVLQGSGRARFTGEHALVLDDGTRVEGESIILCPGGRARRITFPGSDAPGVITHSDVWSLEKLPGSVAVVGAAATGCQLASIFADFGSRVRLLEVAPRILAAEDALVSQVMEDAFRRRGIEILTGIGGIDRIEKTPGDGLRLWFPQQGAVRSIDAEAAVLAVGWVGNIEDLGLGAAGVKAERGFIVVNDRLQTSVPHIYAAGDVTGHLMLVQTANHDGLVAAENALGAADRSHPHRVLPHGGFTDPENGGVGLTEEQARAAESDCAVAVVPYSELDRAVIDGHTAGHCKLIVSRRSRLVLGAHVIGEQAVEIVQVAAAAMSADMPVEELARLELAYPTYTDIVALAARRAIRDLGLTSPQPHWRSLGM